MKTSTYAKLPKTLKQLVDAASAAMKTAYNPYSHFFVGAALKDATGTIISASNVENAAYGSTICAERMALGKANSMKRRKLVAVAIIGRGLEFEAKEPLSPCGSCRQMLFEASQLADTDMDVVMSNTRKDKIVVAKLSQLLPLAFGPKDLGIDLGPYQT